MMDRLIARRFVYKIGLAKDLGNRPHQGPSMCLLGRREGVIWVEGWSPGNESMGMLPFCLVCSYSVQAFI